MDAYVILTFDCMAAFQSVLFNKQQADIKSVPFPFLIRQHSHERRRNREVLHVDRQSKFKISQVTSNHTNTALSNSPVSHTLFITGKN